MPTFHRNILPPSSGIKCRRWKVEGVVYGWRDGRKRDLGNTFHLPASQLRPWRWRQYLSPKRWHLPTKLNGPWNQIIILTAVEISNVTRTRLTLAKKVISFRRTPTTISSVTYWKNVSKLSELLCGGEENITHSEVGVLLAVSQCRYREVYSAVTRWQTRPRSERTT
jgi:hypothetical protein